MTYQARAAWQVHSCAPSFRARYDCLGRGRGGGFGQLLFLILVLQEEARSELKPRAGVQLSHLHTCGFSLKPEKNFTARLQELTPGLLFTALGAHESSPWVKSTVPSQGCSSSSSPFRARGELPLESQQQWLEKINSFPVWQATSSLQH